MESSIDLPITTARLIIRSLQEDDLPFITAVAMEDPEFIKLVNTDEPENLGRAYWKQIVAPNVKNGMIFLRETREFCGRICATYESETLELGITLLDQFQNRGIGPEAITAFANWLHQTDGVERLKARILPGNEHSKHVFEKLGAVLHEQRCMFSDETLHALREFKIDTSKMEKEIVLVYYLTLPL